MFAIDDDDLTERFLDNESDLMTSLLVDKT
jgi:hypothetical protein